MTRIVGISGSPRQGNTRILLEQALNGANSVQGVETRLLELRNLNIKPCMGCFGCSNDRPLPERPCPAHGDDMELVYSELALTHGLILATPVYYGGVSGLLKNFMDRTEPLSRYGRTRYRSALKNVVGGAVAVGANRNGGQETAIQAIHHYFLIQDMIVVGTSTEGLPGCYLGAGATTYPDKGRVVDAVKGDTLAMDAARALGRRVAEVAVMIRAARAGAS
ncbi:MAG: flavodoxin family protein [Deltaproteobacteria bacterium]|nr:flavodoxin family protein [Deltaproteobacteria bacterium]MBW2121448.1 flavodoxin family protein [Deltaproteobacteria bacterium]